MVAVRCDTLQEHTLPLMSTSLAARNKTIGSLIDITLQGIPVLPLVDQRTWRSIALEQLL